MATAGLEVDPAYVVIEPYDVESGIASDGRLMALAVPPTAVFAYSDELAIAALRTAQRRGLSVPGDVSLIGVDGHPTAEVFGITTIDQAVATQGRLAGQLVLDLLAGRQPPSTGTVVPTELVQRSSSGPPPRAVRPAAPTSSAPRKTRTRRQQPH